MSESSRVIEMDYFVRSAGPRLEKSYSPIFVTLTSWRQLICQFMINMAASVEPNDESSERWVLDDSDGDAAYVDKPTVRSQLLYAPVKILD